MGSEQVFPLRLLSEPESKRANLAVTRSRPLNHLRLRKLVLTPLFLALPAMAGRPLGTEDASVLEQGRCQLEAWADHTRVGTTTAWAVPACNFGLGIEWQVGAARTREGGESRFSDAYVQAKRVFLEPDAYPVGVGLVAGLIRRPLNENHRGFDNPFVLIPLTHNLTETTLVHGNIGWLRDREGNRGLTIWGVAIETALSPTWTVLAEAVGENRERPFLRIGARWTVIPKSLDLDLSAVTRSGGDRSDQLISLGFTYVTP